MLFEVMGGLDPRGRSFLWFKCPEDEDVISFTLPNDTRSRRLLAPLLTALAEHEKDRHPKEEPNDDTAEAGESTSGP